MQRRVQLVAGVAASGLLIAAFAGRPGDAVAGDSPFREDARVELGRRLFFDPAIGRAGRVSCAACHDPEHGFSDARVQSVDESGPLPRHSQPLTDLAGRGFHWDGEFDTVREIVEARVLPRAVVAQRATVRAIERAEADFHAHRPFSQKRLEERTRGVTAYYGDRAPAARGGDDESPVDARLAASGVYAKGFAAAFGDARPTAERVVDAVEAYVLGLASTQSPFDRLLAGAKDALGPSALRGRALFEGRAGCVQCHPTTPVDGRARLTDGGFHDTGVAWDAAKEEFLDRGRGPGALHEADDGKFKTPSLRDVARRAPYMHDGRFATLADVVRYYAAGGTPHPGVDPLVRPFDAADGDVADLVAFLESLSGDERAGLGAPTPGRAHRIQVRVVDVSGGPLAGVLVRVAPAGDRLRGAPRNPTPTLATTDAHGRVDVEWPATTHAVLECPAIETLPVPLLPDWTESFEVVAMKVDPDRPVFAVPTGVAEGREVLRAVPSVPAGLRGLAVFHRVRTLSARHTLYVADRPIEFLRGEFQFTTDEGRTIGTYRPAKWTAEARDFRPPPPARDEERVVADDGLRRRVALLMSLK